jgi:hypothetical protein
MGARCVAGNKEMSSCSTASIGRQEVGCITVCYEDHVTCQVGYNGIKMCGHVVNELFDLDHCVLGGICLQGGNGAQCSEHCAVDALCIIEEHANYLLNALLVLVGEGWGCVDGLRVLFGCTVRGFDVGIWLVLRLCQWHVLESDE